MQFLLLTSNRSKSILLLILDRREHAGRQHWDSAGYAGPDGSQDSGDHGAATRLRHRAAHRANQRGSTANQSGHHLPITGSPPATKMDVRRMGNFRKQPQSKVLLPHQSRAEATRARSAELGANLGSDRTRLENRG